LELRPYDRSRCAEHGECNRLLRSVVPAPPGIVMVAPPEISRNTQLGKAKAAPGGEVPKGAARGIIKAGARKPRPDKRRAMGRIEHTLLVGGWLHLNRPKTFAHSPLNPTIPQKVTNVSIYHKGPGSLSGSRPCPDAQVWPGRRGGSPSRPMRY
jgi:hypothetical protein